MFVNIRKISRIGMKTI